MKDYLGKVSLTLDDIRRLSNTDQAYWFALRGTKSGSLEIKVKILSEDCEVSSEKLQNIYKNPSRLI